MEITLDQRLRSAEPHARREHLRVFDGGARVGEGSGVLVDAECEDRGFELAYLHPTFEQYVDHGRRLRTVGG